MLRSTSVFLIIIFAAGLVMTVYLLDMQTNRMTLAVSEPMGCTTQNLSGLIEEQEKIAYINGEKKTIPGLIYETGVATVLGTSTENRWIEVDLSDQKLYAWEGNNLFLETKISTGLPHTPTPQGEFNIWIKLRATKMEGGRGRYYYYLPNVPYTMFFYNDSIPKHKGYGLHGTYWHNDFGTQRSHGCVNLPTPIAKELFYWVSPVLSDGKSVVYADNQNIGTKIIIHD